MFNDGRALLFEGSLGYTPSFNEIDAIKHCRWACDFGQTPTDVLRSVNRPYNQNSTWQDATRAVESAFYAANFAADRNEYKEMLKCL